MSALERIGRGAAGAAAQAVRSFEFLGRVSVAAFRALFRPGAARLPDFVPVFLRTGPEAVPVTMLVGFLLGFIVAFMSATMLQKFGAEIYVANLIGLSLFRELGTIVAAIVLAARSASSFAAEIGTMVVNDEIAAMRVMGIDPVRQLALPRILAGAIALPMLALFADLAGLAGGFLTLSLFGYSLPVFLRNAFAFCRAGDVWFPAVKGLDFGALVAGVGCRRGLETGHGSDAVGRATTAAVVGAIVTFIAADGFFALVMTFIRKLHG